jgi:hypothetical protein
VARALEGCLQEENFNRQLSLIVSANKFDNCRTWCGSTQNAKSDHIA